MYIYWYEVIYQSRTNPLRVSKYLAKIETFQDNYENALISNAVHEFCRNNNSNNWCGEHIIQSVKFIKKVKCK